MKKTTGITPSARRSSGVRTSSQTGQRPGAPPKPFKANTQVSDMLENETKKMEEKLALVKKMMELEKGKRS